VPWTTVTLAPLVAAGLDVSPVAAPMPTRADAARAGDLPPPDPGVGTVVLLL
jgi:hypothetical protein